MIKLPSKYKNYCPGYFLSLALSSLIILTSLITQTSSAKFKNYIMCPHYKFSNKTLDLPHQYKINNCQNEPLNSKNHCMYKIYFNPIVRFDHYHSGITMKYIKENGILELIFPYISGYNGKKKARVLQIMFRDLNVSWTNDLFLLVDEKDQYEFQIRDLGRLKCYDRNLGTPKTAKFYIDEENNTKRFCTISTISQATYYNRSHNS
jgi:hypothetical protein